MAMRRVTYRLYPSCAQERALEAAFSLHHQLYNAALFERIDAWRKGQISISFADQCKSLTALRADDPTLLAGVVRKPSAKNFGGNGENILDASDLIPINVQSLQVTLKRLDKAFTAFFHRAKAGKTPGFPRFKSRDRFAGWGYKTHGDGFKFTPGQNWKHGRLRLSGIGSIEARGEARTPGRVVACDIQRKPGLGPKGEPLWFASIVVECDPHRETRDRVLAFDWGVSTFATRASIELNDDLLDPTAKPFRLIEDGVLDHILIDEVANQRFYRQEEEALKAKQRELSAELQRTRKTKRSKRLLRTKATIARRWRKVGNKRKNSIHQTSAAFVADAKFLIGEALAILNMTASARGTIEEPGKNVAQKAGLNRSILDTCPGEFHSMLAYKAEEAGGEMLLLNPRRFKSSQTCPLCGHRRKKTLAERVHSCEACGFTTGRDRASALDLLQAGVQELRRSRREADEAVRPRSNGQELAVAA